MSAEFRPVIELCQFEMTPEENALCAASVEDYKSKLIAYCSYTQQHENPADQFCLIALPEPEIRTQNILGESARRGRQLVIPQLPVDFDDLPEMLQDKIDEDTYTAIMENEAPPLPGEETGYGLWMGSLRFQYDLFGTNTEIVGESAGPSHPNTDDSTEYLSHFGSRLEVRFRFPFGLTLMTGADYMFDYSKNGANLHTIDWVGGTGYSFMTSDSSELEISAIGRVGYLTSDGDVYNENLGEKFRFSALDATIGMRVDLILRFGNFCFLAGLEGFRAFTNAKVDGLTIETFPYSFMVTLGAGVI